MGVPYSSPTIVIRADATIFKDLVQKLTGPLDGPAKKLRRRGATVPRRSPFKLQERRKHSVRDLEIIKHGVLKSTGSSTRSNGLSSTVKGPAMPVGCDAKRVGTESPLSEEERAIAEKGFYLHASPVKAEPPVLLTLFPLTSPKLEL